MVLLMSVCMQAINEKILSLDYGEYRAELKTVDAQESFNGGVTVLVTGYLTGKDNVSRNFAQSFFLAPQDKGYFVLNDIFRYMEDVSHPDGNQRFGDDVQAPVTPDQGKKNSHVQFTFSSFLLFFFLGPLPFLFLLFFVFVAATGYYFGCRSFSIAGQ